MSEEKIGFGHNNVKLTCIIAPFKLVDHLTSRPGPILREKGPAYSLDGSGMLSIAADDPFADHESSDGAYFVIFIGRWLETDFVGPELLLEVITISFRTDLAGISGVRGLESFSMIGWLAGPGQVRDLAERRTETDGIRAFMLLVVRVSTRSLRWERIERPSSHITHHVLRRREGGKSV
jgi:hypothetical protein